MELPPAPQEIMARYFFDVHADDLSYWDDDGEECQDRDAIERCASDLLTARVLALQETGRLAAAVASVRDDAGNHVVTVMLGSSTGLRFAWAEARPRLKAA